MKLNIIIYASFIDSNIAQSFCLTCIFLSLITVCVIPWPSEEKPEHE